MWRNAALCLLFVVGLAAGEADPSILSAEHPNLQQFQTRSPLDLRPRLSTSQQTQILSDVQQHQQFTFPSPSADPVVFAASAGGSGGSTQVPSLTSQLTFPGIESSTPYSTLARYKVDRKKQSQQIQQQLNNLQQRIQQQQQSLGQSGFVAPGAGNPIYQQQFDLKGQYTQFNNYRPNLNNYNQPLPDIPQPFFNDQQNAQLAEYYEKQRQLEILQRQREQLLLEQQELRRQQEILRLQQEQLRSTLIPTTTTTTTPEPPTTTSASVLLSSPTARKITQSENEIFLRAIATHQKKFTTTQKPVSTQKTRQERFQDEQAIPKDLLALIQAQQNQAVAAGKPKPQIKVIYQTEKPPNSKSKTATSEKDQLLKQLKLALTQSGVDDKERNVTTRDIVLPNGKKVQVITAPNTLSAGPTTTIKPPKAIFDEITQGVVPAGADFEVLRHNKDGKLEDIGKNLPQNQPTKKVTFVVLEEQPDGSYKVQGVKGNAEKDSATDVDSIVERIKKGELKLPPSNSLSSGKTSSGSKTRTNSGKLSVAGTSRYSTTKSADTLPTTFRPTLQPGTRRPLVSVSPNSVSTSDKYVTSASSISGHVFNSVSSTSKPDHGTVRYPTSQYYESNDIVSSTASPGGQSSTYFEYSPRPSTAALPSRSSTPSFVTPAPSVPRAKESLSQLLRGEGLFAMAKYLRQSGLDSVLNETGPYTIFVPTDKAFRTLLVQLGGPEKAEQKFRDNPRLLSGLLLHHVVPGAFRVESLQDEMTGVSLAGTQLRVNVYSMHDHEWNDIKVTTINGARIAPNKRDVEIPQGLAHAIDRVMFPLPVGDLVQTLQADRERRFSSFLKILHASGLEDMLSGTKTFTVFAPTDAAWAEATTKNGGTALWQESDGAEAAKEIVLRHVIPTTLYTAGMRYYHQKETLRQQAPIQIQKTGGRIRVNEGHIVTYNVPATNGVLHAVDTVM